MASSQLTFLMVIGDMVGDRERGEMSGYGEGYDLVEGSGSGSGVVWLGVMWVTDRL